MTIQIDDNIRIELIQEGHASSIHQLVDSNRDYLRTWLSFVDKMQTIEFAEKFVRISMQRNKKGNEFAFVIFFEHVMVGRIGVYKIDYEKKVGEIGYWIGEKLQSRGIITHICRVLIDFCFKDLRLQRVDIKCRNTKFKSKTVAQRLHFTYEGIISEAELGDENIFI